MQPSPVLTVDEIDLSLIEFWARPYAEREGAFQTLRRERPIAYCEEYPFEDDEISFPAGPGYYALTKHRDISEASRHLPTKLLARRPEIPWEQVKGTLAAC